MADQYVINIFLFVEFVVDMKDCPTRITEEVLDTLIFKGADEDLRASQCFF